MKRFFFFHRLLFVLCFASLGIVGKTIDARAQQSTSLATPAKENPYADKTLQQLLRTDVKSAKIMSSSVKKIMKVPLNELLNVNIEQKEYSPEEMMNLSLDNLMHLDVQTATATNKQISSYLSMDLTDLLEIPAGHTLKDFSLKELLVLPIDDLIALRVPPSIRQKLTKKQMMKMTLEELLGLEIDTKN